MLSQVHSSHEVQISVSDEPDPSTTKLHHTSEERFLSTDCAATLTSSFTASDNATKSDLVLLEETVLGNIMGIPPSALGCTQRYLVNGTANSNFCSVRNNQLCKIGSRQEGAEHSVSAHGVLDEDTP